MLVTGTVLKLDPTVYFQPLLGYEVQRVCLVLDWQLVRIEPLMLVNYGNSSIGLLDKIWDECMS